MQTSVRAWLERRGRNDEGREGGGRDAGMTTAEYAVGTVAACGFGGVLYKILTSDSVQKMLKDIIERALSVSF